MERTLWEGVSRFKVFYLKYKEDTSEGNKSLEKWEGKDSELDLGEKDQ